MSQSPDLEPDVDEPLDELIAETFERCESCGQIVVAEGGGSHRCPDDSLSIETSTETSPDERRRRREADDRPDSTTVFALATSSGRVSSYHETTDCQSALDDVEPMSLGEARKKNRVPCASLVCRRERDDRVYGELYEPLDD